MLFIVQSKLRQFRMVRLVNTKERLINELKHRLSLVQRRLKLELSPAERLAAEVEYKAFETALGLVESHFAQRDKRVSGEDGHKRKD